MNPNIIQAIEQDNLDLFKLLYNPYLKFNDNEDDKFKIQYMIEFLFTKELAIFNSLLRKKVNEIDDSYKQEVSEDLINTIIHMIKLCFVYNSTNIFNYMMTNVLNELKYLVNSWSLAPYFTINDFEEFNFYTKMILEGKFGLSDYVLYYNIFLIFCGSFWLSTKENLSITNVDEELLKSLFNDLYNSMEFTNCWFTMEHNSIMNTIELLFPDDNNNFGSWDNLYKAINKK